MNRLFNQLLSRCTISLGERRSANKRKGRGRNRLENHILILGGGSLLEGVLNVIARRSEWAGLEIVVLSSQGSDQVRNRVSLALPPEVHGLSITYCFGNRTKEEDLVMCQVDRADLLFIIGEDGENGHDALNYECWEKTRALRLHATDAAQCYLFLEHSSTISLLHKLPQEAHTSIETTIVNPYEAMMQQLLEGDVRQEDCRSLDRGHCRNGSICTPCRGGDDFRWIYFCHHSGPTMPFPQFPRVVASSYSYKDYFCGSRG